MFCLFIQIASILLSFILGWIGAVLYRRNRDRRKLKAKDDPFAWAKR